MQVTCDCLEETGDSLFPVDLRISNETLSEFKATPRLYKIKIFADFQEANEQVERDHLINPILLPPSAARAALTTAKETEHGNDRSSIHGAVYSTNLSTRCGLNYLLVC